VFYLSLKTLRRTRLIGKMCGVYAHVCGGSFPPPDRCLLNKVIFYIKCFIFFLKTLLLTSVMIVAVQLVFLTSWL
jgi:hypothetical protein